MIAAICLVVNSCTIETSDNGDFDGFWHLERVDTLATGNYLDLSKERVFWGVQHKLISCASITATICTASVVIISDSNRLETV